MRARLETFLGAYGAAYVVGVVVGVSAVAMWAVLILLAGCSAPFEAQAPELADGSQAPTPDAPAELAPDAGADGSGHDLGTVTEAADAAAENAADAPGTDATPDAAAPETDAPQCLGDGEHCYQHAIPCCGPDTCFPLTPNFWTCQ